MREISKIENGGSPLKCVVLTSSVRKKKGELVVAIGIGVRLGIKVIL
jgi:hypothetical protein